MRISIIFIRVFIQSVCDLWPIGMCFAVAISGLGWLVGRLEGLSLGDGLYFAWITGTTVGYGDIVPSHPISQGLCVLIAVVGVLFTGTLAAIAVNSLKITFQLENGLENWEEILLSKFKREK